MYSPLYSRLAVDPSLQEIYVKLHGQFRERQNPKWRGPFHRRGEWSASEARCYLHRVRLGVERLLPQPETISREWRTPYLLSSSVE